MSDECISGLVVPVLFTGPGRHPGQIGGRSPWQQAVHVAAPAAPAPAPAPKPASPKPAAPKK